VLGSEFIEASPFGVTGRTDRTNAKTSGVFKAAWRRSRNNWRPLAEGTEAHGPTWCCTKTRSLTALHPLLPEHVDAGFGPARARATRAAGDLHAVPGDWRHFFQLDAWNFRPATPHRTPSPASARSNAPSNTCFATSRQFHAFRAIAGIDMAIDLHARMRRSAAPSTRA